MTQSKNWDMDITFEELVKHNEHCKVDRDYKLHKSDSCYRGYCMYLKHPNSEKYTTMIGIGEDGFMYIGDSCEVNFPLEHTEYIVQEMELYKDWINKMELNKVKLMNKGIDYDNYKEER